MAYGIGKHISRANTQPTSATSRPKLSVGVAAVAVGAVVGTDVGTADGACVGSDEGAIVGVTPVLGRGRY